MKKQFNLLAIFLLSFVYFSLSAQTSTSALETESLSQQFDYVISKSNTFEDYKVVKLQSLKMLKSNSVDSLAELSGRFTAAQKEVNVLNKKNDSLYSEIDTLSKELQSLKESKDSVSFLGSEVPKSTYSATMWGIVFILLFGIIAMVLLLKRHMHLTKEAQIHAVELEEEFENHRKTALRREQKLARELMDFKVKNKF